MSFLRYLPNQAEGLFSVPLVCADRYYIVLSWISREKTGAKSWFPLETPWAWFLYRPRSHFPSNWKSHGFSQFRWTEKAKGEIRSNKSSQSWVTNVRSTSSTKSYTWVQTVESQYIPYRICCRFWLSCSGRWSYFVIHAAWVPIPSALPHFFECLVTPPLQTYAPTSWHTAIHQPHHYFGFHCCSTSVCLSVEDPLVPNDHSGLDSLPDVPTSITRTLCSIRREALRVAREKTTLSPLSVLNHLQQNKS